MTIKLNVIDLPKDDYKGGKSTLCPGCGHDQISNVIINAAWDNGLHPEKLAKMSGIGCSSKTPAWKIPRGQHRPRADARGDHRSGHGQPWPHVPCRLR